MYVGNMHFHHRRFDGSNSITNGDRSVSVTTGIQDDTIIIKADPLQFVDQFSFHIALKIAGLNIGVFLFKGIQKLLKGHIAIDIGFSFAEQVEIGAVDNGDFHAPNIAHELHEWKRIIFYEQ